MLAFSPRYILSEKEATLIDSCRNKDYARDEKLAEENKRLRDEIDKQMRANKKHKGVHHPFWHHTLACTVSSVEANQTCVAFQLSLPPLSGGSRCM